jgi:hypothetical protein
MLEKSLQVAERFVKLDRVELFFEYDSSYGYTNTEH